MKNETLDTIMTRRSVRKYQEKQITGEELDAVLQAGLYAPCGRGSQCVVLAAVQDKETRARLTAMNAAVWGKDMDTYYGAPTIIIALADPEQNTWVEDGSCALTAMMEAAHALGLGSCWIHREREMFDSPEGKEFLRKWGLPETLRGVGALSLGYAEGGPSAPAPRKEGRVVKVL